MAAPGTPRPCWLNRLAVIEPGTPAAEGLSEEDLAKRQRGFKTAKEKLVNPNFFVRSLLLSLSVTDSDGQVSRERLSIRNLPSSVDETKLKEMCLEAAKSAGGVPRVRQVKIERDPERKNKHGEAKSRGFGFVEFQSHEHALAALRKINNNPEVRFPVGLLGWAPLKLRQYFGPSRRPIVMFAVENHLELKKRNDRSAHSSSGPPMSSSSLSRASWQSLALRSGPRMV